ncbi:helix-turn-helix transcriptional regulator [Microbacterium sp. M3]|uniref:Helix-turn-helix transcriptional regulator n=1 Tax=Microbacterium arthrosphaerae TaxID=792652 RepID=A0ABU4GZV4_9MICO|nr:MULTISPECIES: helix-turn-helix transcriptional regulator [Microbacterium]MDW4571970.1 helix-turn-helix transcriptional regulator [Microbacterium arthrosphaerae]MDW7605825.1 helix-turn-helix transcriptional regulator [Microbacterium sp. M3]
MTTPSTSAPAQPGRALLRNPEAELYGLEIGEAAGLRSGTVHPILARLEGVGWVTSRWEDIDPSVEGRPARRYYKLDAGGEEAARSALARAYQSRRAPHGALIPRPEQ